MCRFFGIWTVHLSSPLTQVNAYDAVRFNIETEVKKQTKRRKKQIVYDFSLFFFHLFFFRGFLCVASFDDSHVMGNKQQQPTRFVKVGECWMAGPNKPSDYISEAHEKGPNKTNHKKKIVLSLSLCLSVCMCCFLTFLVIFR